MNGNRRNMKNQKINELSRWLRQMAMKCERDAAIAKRYETVERCKGRRRAYLNALRKLWALVR